ncbi:MAG: hypothetical protein LC785_11670 [Acidobacteria bacterium]|nr:hypothetical protein [Acidobacteriota bacterium]MCA1642584.1 hypothetical protein [Acidobacteriota bacterium]
MRYSFPRSFRDADVGALPPELIAQVRLSILLGYGFAFSAIGVGGLGSLAAFAIGLAARRRIKRSGGRLAGLWLAWWCILTGALGALVLPLALLMILSKLSSGG